jgi:dTDP-4-dehydrorhamnose 3,5-epimerase
MKVTKCEIEGLLVIELNIYSDNRGFFIERFNLKEFQSLNLPVNFIQDNHSRSKAGVIRGLHAQYNPNQGKLVGVSRGRIWDVAVDIRKDSATFGKYFSIELSEDNGKLLWIPEGFAHGFCVIGDQPVDVLYKVTSLYNPKTEVGIIWNDPELNIKWPIAEPVLSERDQSMKSFAEYRKLPDIKW